MDFGQIEQALVEAAVAILIALVGVGVAYLRNYSKQMIEDKKIAASVDLTLTTVENSVKSSIQALGVDAKKAVADGVISKSELVQMQNNAIKHFETQVAPELQKRLEVHVGDVEGFITTKVAAELQKVDKVTG